MHRSLHLLTLSLLLAAAGPASALAGSLSDDDLVDDDCELEMSELTEEDRIQEIPAQEEIVPCAVLDSEILGLGQRCAAAKVWVHTTEGVLLCSLVLPELPELESSERAERAPPTGAAGSASSTALPLPELTRVPRAPTFSERRAPILGYMFVAPEGAQLSIVAPG